MTIPPQTMRRDDAFEGPLSLAPDDASDDAHDRCVEAWLLGCRPISFSQALDSFESALQALWWRASVSVGEVGLSALVGAALRRARARHPFLRAVTVGPAGVRCERASAPLPTLDDLFAGWRFLLAEMLRVIGRCTAQILTPPLHAELARVLPRASVSSTRRLRKASRLPSAAKSGP